MHQAKADAPKTIPPSPVYARIIEEANQARASKLKEAAQKFLKLLSKKADGRNTAATRQREKTYEPVPRSSRI